MKICVANVLPHVVYIFAMTTAIIPSRFGSKRFEGKALANIRGLPMILHVYRRAKLAENISRVVVATDDTRISEVVKSYGGEAVMTSPVMRSGTDRVAQAAEMLDLPDQEVVVNIQGDQPVFRPECLDSLVSPFKEDSDMYMATLACRISGEEQMEDPNCVKVVFNHYGDALYFSRAGIPFSRDDKALVQGYKHLGFYAYTNSFLQKAANLPSGVFEPVEKLEQLRVLEFGYKIRVVVTRYDSPGVDQPPDIRKIEKLLPESCV